MNYANKKSKLKFIIIIAIIIVVVLLIVRRFVIQHETEFVSNPMVNVTHIKRTNIEKQSSVNGTIMPNDTYYVVNKVGGEITKIYVENGQSVKKGDKICEIDNSKQIESAFIQYDAAKNAFNRVEKLYKSGDVSKQNYEQAKAQYDGAKLAYDTQVEFATPVAVGDGVIENTNMNLDVTIQSGTVLCYITGTDSKEIQFGVTERVLSGIKLYDKVVIEKNGKSYKGYIKDKATLINQSTGLFDVKAAITDENNFASGIMAKVTFTFDKSNNTYVLPRDIVYHENNKPFVYILGEDSKITTKFFDTGIETADKIEVTSGLLESDDIICTWNSDLNVGAQVEKKDTIDINTLLVSEVA